VSRPFHFRDTIHRAVSGAGRKSLHLHGCVCGNVRMKTRTVFLAMIFASAVTVAGDSDRVTFPDGYAQQLRQLGQALHNERSGVTTVYANELAANAAKAGVTQFPEGSVIVMEFAKPVKDSGGQLLRDAQGVLLKGEIEHVDVMKRGAAATDDQSRAGHWSFASYGPDGKVLVAPGAATQCAACHSQGAAQQDFVFRKRPWF
jgi:hypothetical protein